MLTRSKKNAELKVDYITQFQKRKRAGKYSRSATDFVSGYICKIQK